VLQSIALAVVLTWPMPMHPALAAIGGAQTDTPKHLWTLWWMRQEMWHGTPGLLTTWVNWPDGMPLFPIEPLDGLFAVLLPLPPTLLSNGLAFVHVVLLGVCAAWLGECVVGTRIGAHVAGALAMGASFTGFTLQVGVGELRQTWWIPLGLACLVRARETLQWRWFLALAGALAGASLSCFYHGLFLGTAVAVWALATLLPDRRLLLGYSVAAGLAIAVVLPVVKGFAATYGKDSAPTVIFDAQGSVVESYRGAAMNVDQLLTPRMLSPGPVDARALRYDGGRYLGWGALVLGVIGVAAAPRRAGPWVGVLAVSVVLSLGTVLWWHGNRVLVGGKQLALPLAWLNDALRHVGEPINFPARYIAPGMIALAVLGALATRWRWTAVLVPLALLDAGANDLVRWPRSTCALPTLAPLGSNAGTGAVADLTAMANQDAQTRNLDIAAQLAIGRPFGGVPIERLSAWADSGDRWLQALPLARAVSWVTQEPVDPAADWRDDLWLLRDRGFDRLLVTFPGDSPDGRADALLTRLCGPPVRADHAAMWTVPDVPATDAEATAWRSAQQERVRGPRPSVAAGPGGR
jgi:hypothetical protein